MIGSTKVIAIIGILVLGCYCMYLKGRVNALEAENLNVNLQLQTANNILSIQNKQVTKLKANEKILNDALQINLRQSENKYKQIDKNLSCERKLDELLKAFDSRK